MTRKKDKNMLPGNVIFTPELKRQRNISYLKFLRSYQDELIKNRKVSK